MTLYIVPRTKRRIVAPNHHAELEITNIEEGATTLAQAEFLAEDQVTDKGSVRPTSLTIRVTPREAIIDGPGAVQYRSLFDDPAGEVRVGKSFRLTARFTPVRSGAPVSVSAVLSEEDSDDETTRWVMKGGEVDSDPDVQNGEDER
jgi:hypothetical protein